VKKRERPFIMAHESAGKMGAGCGVGKGSVQSSGESIQGGAKKRQRPLPEASKAGRGNRPILQEERTADIKTTAGVKIKGGYNLHRKGRRTWGLTTGQPSTNY